MLKNLDILGTEPQIYIYGEKRFKTIFGGIMSILTITLILIFFVFFSVELLSRDKFSLISSEKSNNSPQINMTNTPFFFKISDPLGNVINSSVTFPYFTIWNYYAENKGVPNITKMFLEPCDINLHFGEYKNLIKESEIKNNYCMPLNKYNLTLFGKNGDVSNGFSKMNIHILKCTNNTAYQPFKTPIQCLSAENIQFY